MSDKPKPEFIAGPLPEGISDDPGHTFDPVRSTVVEDFQSGAGELSATVVPTLPQGWVLGATEPPSAGESHRLLQEIGKGGMGIVYQGIQRSLRRVVAIKMMRPDYVGRDTSDSPRGQQIAASFREEAFTAAQLDHPNILPVYDLGANEAGDPFISMKLVQGTPWNELIKSEFSTSSVEEFLMKHVPILLSVSQAVAFAHSRGIIHRDIKPGQVMIGDYGEVLLLDWGLAVNFDEALLSAGGRSHALGSAPTLAKANNPAGSPAYMAPEQTYKTTDKLGPWTDVYLLGSALFELVTGKRPHEALTTTHAFTMANEGRYHEPTLLTPGREIPQPLLDLIRDSLNPDIAKRMHSAREFGERLRGFLSGAGRRRESEELSTAIKTRIEAGTKDYHELSDCIATLDRAEVLWPANPAVVSLRARALVEFGRQAVQNGDCVLARAQADRMAPSEARTHLLAEVDRSEARARTDATTRRAALGVAAVLVVLITGGTIKFNSRLASEVIQKEEARRIAEAARSRSERARAEAEELVAFMVGDLAGSLEPIGKLDIIDSVLAQVGNHLDKRGSEELSEAERDSQMRLLIQIADVRIAQGDLDSAEKAARRALAEASAISAANPSSSMGQKQSALAWERIGDILETRGDIEGAATAFETALSISQKLADAQKLDSERQSALSVSLNRVGGIRQQQGNLEGAREAFNKSLAISDQLAAQEPSVTKWKADMGFTWHRIGNILEEQGSMDEARAAYQKCLDLYIALVASEPDNAEHKRRLGIFWNRMGDVHTVQGNIAEARSAYEKGLATAEMLAASDPSNAVWRRSVGVSWNRMGDFLIETGKIEDALAAYRKALAISQELAAGDPSNIRIQGDLGTSWNRVGDALEMSGDADAAREAFDKSVAVFELVAAADPTNPQAKRNVAAGWSRIGGILYAQGKFDESLTAFQKCLATFELVAATDATNAQWKRDVGSTWLRVGGAQEGLKQNAAAVEAYGKSLAIMDELSSSDPSNAGWRNDKAMSQYRLAMLLSDLGERDRAIELLRACVKTREELVEQLPDNPRLKDYLEQVRSALAKVEEGAAGG
jgi:serine/threonine protein kinase